MFVIGNFINSLAKVVDFVLNAYMWVIIGRAIISWFSPDPYNPIVRFLYDITEPLLSRIRRILPFSSIAGIDFSPMIVILIILFLQSFVVHTLHGIARSFG